MHQLDSGLNFREKEEEDAQQYLLTESGLDFREKPLLRDVKKYLKKHSQYLQQPEPSFIFNSLVQRFQHYPKQSFVCAKIFTPKDSKSMKVYRCEDCSLEANSVICTSCFQPDKHKGHKCDTIDVVGGCCDCGDELKLKEQGFCSEHRFDKKKQAKQLAKEDREFFLEFCSEMMWTLCCLYNAIEERKKESKQDPERERLVLRHMIRKVDPLGETFLNTLTELNKDRYSLNCMTRQWLSQQNTYLHHLTYVHEAATMEQLMLFLDLPKTAEACVPLFILLFNQGKKFREQITKLYFKLYSEIIFYNRSRYRDFSAQLFPNSKILFKLIKNNQKIKPIVIDCLVEGSLEGEELLEEVKSLGESYSNYYEDLHFLLELKETQSIAYWKYFEENCGMMKLLSYPQELMTEDKIIALANKHIYQIEETGLATCAEVMEMIIREPGFIEKNIQILFKTILVGRGKSWQKRPKCLFFSEYRLLSLFLFLYFFSKKGIARSSEISKVHLQDLISVLGTDQHHFERDLMDLFEDIIKYFQRISLTMSSNGSIQANMSFAMTYFKSNQNCNFLYSLDAFLLKFTVTSLLELNPQEIRYQQMEQLLSSRIEKVLEQMNRLFKKRVLDYHIEDDKWRRYKHEDYKLATKQRFAAIQECVLSFHNFVNLINQSIFSDLVDLVLLSHFPSLLEDAQPRYDSTFLTFYQKVLATMKPTNKMVPLIDFRRLVRFLFFKEDSVFSKFVAGRLNSKDREFLDTVETSPSSLDHFYSLRFKLSVANMEKMIVKPSLRVPPFLERNKKGTNLFLGTSYLKIVQSWLSECMRIQESQNNLINDLTKQLVRMDALTCHKLKMRIHKYFSSQFPKLIVEPPLTNSERTLSVYSYLNRDVELELQAYKKQFIIEGTDIGDDSISQLIKMHQQINQEEQDMIDLRLEEIEIKDTKEEKIKKLFFDQSCMLGAECLNKNNDSPLYWLTYVRLTNMHWVFSISPAQRILTFVSCSHSCHQSCFQKLAKDQQVTCRRCKKKANFLLIPTQTILAEEQPRTAILQELESLSQLWSYSPKKMALELFRSITLFLSLFFILSDFSIIHNHLLLYQNLYNKLKLVELSSPSLHTLNKEMEIQLLSSVSEWAERIKVMQILLKKSFLPSSASHTKEENRLLGQYKDQANYLQQILQFLESKNSEWKIEPLAAENQRMRLIEHFIPKQLPSTLNLLSQNRTCTDCKATGDIAYFVCMMPHLQHPQYTLCSKCYQHGKQQHIQKCHFNENIFLDTDSGRPHYYCLADMAASDLQSKGTTPEFKLLCYEGQSLYQNIYSAPYLKGKKYNKAEFTLSQRKLRELLQSVCCWSLFPFSK